MATFPSATTDCGRELHILTTLTVKYTLRRLWLNLFSSNFIEWPSVFMSDQRLNSFLPMMESFLQVIVQIQNDYVLRVQVGNNVLI